jgi:predicted nucleotide-binding protein
VHQELLADVVSVRHAFSIAADMATLIERAATHLERESSRRTLHPEPRPSGSRVFIGHGHSPLWRQLKDFLHERLGLPWEEFNRIPAAGITNIARLSEMLENAVMSFHVLTAEDERKDGTQVARLNVVHEAGLFQGKLGFTRAIVIIEEGCEEFSNIHGLGQIRFPTGHIEATYEEVRRVLEREAILLRGDS